MLENVFPIIRGTSEETLKCFLIIRGVRRVAHECFRSFGSPAKMFGNIFISYELTSWACKCLHVIQFASWKVLVSSEVTSGGANKYFRISGRQCGVNDRIFLSVDPRHKWFSDIQNQSKLLGNVFRFVWESVKLSRNVSRSFGESSDEIINVLLSSW